MNGRGCMRRVNAVALLVAYRRLEARVGNKQVSARIERHAPQNTEREPSGGGRHAACSESDSIARRGINLIDTSWDRSRAARVGDIETPSGAHRNSMGTEQPRRNHDFRVCTRRGIDSEELPRGTIGDGDDDVADVEFQCLRRARPEEPEREQGDPARARPDSL